MIIIFILIGILFLFVGLLMSIKPEVTAKIQAWKMETFLGAKYIPSNRTMITIRIIGVVVILFSLFFLWRAFSV